MSVLFAAISALVGFLFAFNAMLFTVPQRRRLVLDLRREGYGGPDVIAVLLLDALALGLISCALGLALGDELSIHLFHSNPTFLSLAFALDSKRAIGVQSVAMAVGGGMLAAVVAVLSPMRDVLPGHRLAAVGPRKRAMRRRDGRRAGLAGLACLVAASVILLSAPDAAIPGMVLLVAALLLVLPLALEITLALVTWLAAKTIGVVPHVATLELGAAGARAVAIAATGAVAIFGSVAIQGAHDDLLAGLQGAARDMNSSAEIWVAPAGSYDLMHTVPFAPVERARLERLPGVRAVRLYRGGLMDYGERRVLVIAPPASVASLLPAREILQGDSAKAAERVRAGDWVVLSKALAAEQGLRVGETFTIPSPRPSTFRVAALSTNFGWAPGAIVMSASSCARAWGSEDVNAYGIVVARGVTSERVVREIERTLGPRSGLAVQTASKRAAQQTALSRQALSRLTEIAGLIPIVAVLAMVAAMGAMIWQRRPHLARLQMEGLRRADLWQTILLESMLLLGAGCFTGAIFGLYGQHLADRALAETINFPVVYSIAAGPALSSLALMAVTALAIIAIPGYLAASASPAVAMRD